MKNLSNFLKKLSRRIAKKAMNNSKSEYMAFLRNKFNYDANFSPDDYLYMFGKESDAFFYSTLYLPELIEVESVVFLQWGVDSQEAINKLKDNLKKDKTNPTRLVELEESYNYIEVGYLFSDSDLDDHHEQLFAEKIRLAWDGWLKIKYPERKFNVRIMSEEETAGPVGVTFHEIRNNFNG